MMYKNILLTIILSISSISLFAQKPRMSREEFRQCQEKYIKEQTRLTQQEAQQFFPLYFELQDKKDAINRQAWAQMRKGKEENLSEAEYNKIVEEIIKARISCDQLDLEYLHKYQKFLSSKQIFNIQRAEMKFHRELLKPHRKN